MNAIFSIGNISENKVESLTIYEVNCDKKKFIINCYFVDVNESNLIDFFTTYGRQLQGNEDGIFEVLTDNPNCIEGMVLNNFDVKYIDDNGTKTNYNKPNSALVLISYGMLAKKYGARSISAINPKFLKGYTGSEVKNYILYKALNGQFNKRIEKQASQTLDKFESII